MSTNIKRILSGSKTLDKELIMLQARILDLTLKNANVYKQRILVNTTVITTDIKKKKPISKEWRVYVCVCARDRDR